MPDRWHTLLAADFDRWAVATYAANFPGVEVRRAAVADLVDALPDADCVLGGPPCQPHSHAGKRKASKDERDGGPDFVAAVRKVKPRQFLMENVEGLLSSEGGRYYQNLYVALEDAGYVVQHRVLDAVSFGVPQFRVRVWTWGIRRDLYTAGIRHQWPKPTHAWPPQGACLFGAPLLSGVTVGQALGLDETVTLYNVNHFWDGASAESPTYQSDRPARTLKARESHGIVIGEFDHAARRERLKQQRKVRAAIRRGRGASIERRDHPLSEPCPTVPAATGGSGGLFLVQAQEETRVEAVSGVQGAGHAQLLSRLPDVRTVQRDGQDQPERGSELRGVCGAAVQTAEVIRVQTVANGFSYDHGVAVPEEPSPTLKAGGNFANGRQGGGCPPVIAYRWSDATGRPAPTLVGGSAKSHVNDLSVVNDQTWREQFKSAPGGPLSAGGWKRKGDLWVRRLTPLECARLQSVPDCFVWPDGLSKTNAYRIIGNGWSCGMADAMSRALATADPDSRTVIDLYCGGGLGAVGWHGRAWRYLNGLEQHNPAPADARPPGAVSTRREQKQDGGI